MILFKRLTENAILPKRATEGAAGFDLYTNDYCVEIHPLQQLEFKTGIACEIPKDWAGKIEPRSGWARKYGIAVQAGRIDHDYRGELIVILINLGKEPVTIRTGDRIAQMVVQPYMSESCEIDNLHATDRGANGFGSTGR